MKRMNVDQENGSGKEVEALVKAAMSKYESRLDQ